ncbi:MAG: hypothetical protein H6536_03095 [Bacteroidales bacterium]|nr:hypothetical protein [Bacteroidales bacterium]
MEQNRNNYQKKAHNTIDDLFKGINSLEEKVKTASKDLSDTMEQNIQQMKAEGEKLKEKLNELGNTNNESWEEIKNGFEDAATSLRDAFSKAWNKYKDK